MNATSKQRFDNAIVRLERAVEDSHIIEQIVTEYLKESTQPIDAKTRELRLLEGQVSEQQAILNDLDKQIKRRTQDLAASHGWNETKQEFVIRQLTQAMDAILRERWNLSNREIKSKVARIINHRINELLNISSLRLSDKTIRDYSLVAKEYRTKLAIELRSGRDRLRNLKNVEHDRLQALETLERDRIDELKMLKSQRLQFLDNLNNFISKNNFAPVPAPELDVNQISKNGTTVPNKAAIYFLWEGALIAYVGQSTNLARRLINHERMKPTDKISYLCIDQSDLNFHEAFYIGVCRPFRNGRI